MKRKVSKSSVSPSTLDRVYRALPFLFLVMSGLNVWFLVSYVQAERQAVNLNRDELLSSVSNVYSFVLGSLSNEIQQVRFRSSLVSRPVYSSPSTGVVVSVASPVTSAVHSVARSYIPAERVDGWYAIVSGVPCVSFGGNSLYFVGDDFGFGKIDRITRYFVFCDGQRIRLSFPPESFPSRPVPLPVSSQIEKGVVLNDR